MAKKARENEPPPADSFERLIHELEKLPGVGRRAAERMAYALLSAPREEAMALALAIRDVKRNLHPCAECGDLTERERCAICDDPRRDAGVVCLVEWPRDARAIEKCAEFRGRYHVLMGRLSPLSGVEPEDLRLDTLWTRLKNGAVREVVLATSPTVEGDATATFLAGRIRDLAREVKVTRLARGLPAGSDLSFAQAGTIGDALKGRTEIR